MAGNKVDMKTVLLGKGHTGKTCLMERYLHDKYEPGETRATIGAAYAAKRILIDGKSLVMAIWDTAGGERYEAMSRIYYRGADAAIVCYDITDLSSFARVRFWVQELKKNEMDCKVYMCGTKKDLIDQDPAQRKVDIHDATDFADECQAELFETSSKTGENIGNLFCKIAEDYLSSKNTLNSMSTSGIRLEDEVPSSGSRHQCSGCPVRIKR